jgi:hypothetical protein
MKGGKARKMGFAQRRGVRRGAKKKGDFTRRHEDVVMRRRQEFHSNGRAKRARGILERLCRWRSSFV